ncbi:tryptophan synthase beta subunit-like PLP-dependent enzyme [Cladochytrium replicatum]|nr:tryptophan synthase beta subunit-like PLP-dependent enzyme [Cladochytrium replicatum]
MDPEQKHSVNGKHPAAPVDTHSKDEPSTQNHGPEYQPVPAFMNNPLYRSLTRGQYFTPMSSAPPFVFPPSSIPHPHRPPTPTHYADGVKHKDIDYLKLILNARVYDVAIESPLTHAPKLSVKTGNKIYLKREDLQPIFSFKIRGSYNRMFQLTPEERARGICCVSAGNHAQGVALAAQKLNIKATIVMPNFAPEIKVESVKRMGANVILYGDSFDEAKQYVNRIAEEQKLTFVAPFDDPYIIAGQGTVGVEILRQLKQDRLDAIFVCCGGGGLLAGIGAYVKRIRPEVRIIGVNTADSDAMYQSLLKGERVELKDAGVFSDGTSMKLVGEETFRLAQMYVDDMILVSTDEVCSAIKDVFDDTRSIPEPSGALAVAGVKKFIGQNPRMKDGVFVAIVSGANMNFDRLRFVAERSRIGEGREALVSSKIPERPGSFSSLYNMIYPRFVTEFSYRYSNPDTAHAFMAFEVSNGPEEIESVIATLNANGMETIDLTGNEMAKTHGRYLMGGRRPWPTKSGGDEDEILIRFTFPERPGALRKFLGVLDAPGKWNLTLLHYRNHGSDVGRVLAGLQMPAKENDQFKKYMDDMGLQYYDETGNPAYHHFLR